MKKSMNLMNHGMTDIQTGFMNNNLDMIKNGVVMVEEGNKLFSDLKTISKYMPDNKKHLSNTAKKHSDTIKQQINVLTGNLDKNAYLQAGKAYADMLNACSSCHAIVRNW